MERLKENSKIGETEDRHKKKKQKKKNHYDSNTIGFQKVPRTG